MWNVIEPIGSPTLFYGFFVLLIISAIYDSEET